ncbi:MAG: arsenate reductase ArsC [Bacteroidetes bacterium]|nr:arsenate reductase ArsC [Bacteroidota bacterium]
MNIRILILCTGNSCRSQMAAGFLKSFKKNLEVFSAGTEPTAEINPYAVRVMQEKGIDISTNRPRNVDEFTSQPFDYVITVCDHAKETCPVFTGQVKHRLYIGFEDPTDFAGSEEATMAVYREIRDQIEIQFNKFLQEHLKD